MKILRIVSSGYEQGGAENGIVLTNKILRDHGHQVKVISSNSQPQLSHYSDYEFETVPDHGLKQLFYAAFNYSAYRTTKQVLTTFQPDVVLLHTMSQPTAAVLFLLKKYPTVQFVHGPELFTKSLLPWYLQSRDYKHGSFELNDLTLTGKLHYYYFKYACAPLYKLSFHNINKLVALSSYTLQMLQGEGYKPELLPNGVKLLDPKPLPKKLSLLYAGRLEKFKGIDDLIRAVPEILHSIPKVHLYIAGMGNYSAELKALTRELGLEKAVSFLGHLNTKELATAYKNASVFVLPSTWPETFGKVGVEAMSVGRPVIATDVGGVKDWLKDGVNGYFVKPHHPEQIARKTIAILSDPHKLEQMAAAASKSAQKFSIATMTANIETLLSDVQNNT